MNAAALGTRAARHDVMWLGVYEENHRALCDDEVCPHNLALFIVGGAVAVWALRLLIALRSRSA